MRFLLLSSLLFFVACAHSPYEQLQKSNSINCIEKFRPQFSKVLFSTNVDVIGKHLSGLLFFKTMPDSSVRVVFTNQTGATFFDFEFKQNNFKVIYCIKQLNRKAVINQLRKDFELPLFLFDKNSSQSFVLNDERYQRFTSGKEFSYYITDTNCTSLKRIECASKKKKKTIVTFDTYGNDFPDSIFIEHQLYNFTISLKKTQHAAE